LKALNSAHYTKLNQQLDSSPLGRFARIMNWGYADDGSPGDSAVAALRTYINENATRLVTEAIGAEVLTGRDIVEIGCGRGGNLALIHTYYQPARLVGLDHCASSIEYCERTYRPMGIEFVIGDAEELPFGNAEFDCVLNIESSHSYPNLDRFFLGVARVLRPAGAFLIADMFIEEQHDELLSYLASIGLKVERDRDITDNVLLSREQSAERQLSALGQLAGHPSMSELWGGEQSTVRRMLAERTLRYRLITARRAVKPVSAFQPAAVDPAIFTAPAAIFSPFWTVG
jgi:phthiocerol/phenolphthiocerol synthesis type-I polyketide synthase E